MPKKYIEKILRAKVYDVAIETPLDFAPSLSERLANTRLFKTGRFATGVSRLNYAAPITKCPCWTEQEKAHGVIAASAGNHAQGVALSAKKLGIKALIVMPKTTPEIKVQSVKARGAKTVLFGDSYDEAYAHAMELAAAKRHGFYSSL